MNKKQIIFPIEIKAVNHPRSYILQKAFTNDLNSVELVFKLTDCTTADLTGATASVLLFMRDGSFFQDIPTISGTDVKYTLTEAQGNHAGVAQAQIIVKSGTDEWASDKQKFEIIAGLETVVATEVMIKDWTMLTAEARAYLDEFEANEVTRQQTAANAESARAQTFTTNEAGRQSTFSANEATRETNETARKAAEVGRVTAEQGRATAESGRVTAESARVTEEQARKDAEVIRQTGYAQMNGRITDLEARSLKKYGVRRVLEATSPLLTRLYDAVGKTAQVPTDDGAATNDFDAIYPWSHIRECKLAGRRVYYKGDPTYDGLTACDWMVEIPKFYLSITQDSTNRDIVISQYRHAGFWLPQVFRTESGAELDKIYVGRFKTGLDGTTDVSRPGVWAENYRDLASFRAGARAKGVGWQQLDLSYVQEVLYPLYTIESATLNSQDYLGAGLTGFRYSSSDTAKLAETAVNRIVVTNATATNYNVGEGICIGASQGSENIAFDRTILSKVALPDGLNTGIVFDGAPVNIAVGNVLWQGAQKTGQTVTLAKPNGKLSGTAGRRSNKYRGLEDIFGNVYEWTDGVLINERITQVCRKPSLYTSTMTADYKPVGYTNVTTDGFPKEMGWDENYPEARLPVTVGAGTTTGYCDYHYSNTGLRGACFGGGANNVSYAGLFCWFLYYSPATTNWAVGSRLMYKGV